MPPAATRDASNWAGSPARIDAGRRKSATGGRLVKGLAAGNWSPLLPSTLQSLNSSAVYCPGPVTAARPLPGIVERRKSRQSTSRPPSCTP